VSADIDAIRRRVAEWEKATGPGGDKAWLAGLLARDARTLLAEIDRLRGEWDRLVNERAANHHPRHRSRPTPRPREWPR